MAGPRVLPPLNEWYYIIPPISGIAGAGLSSLISLIVASVVKSKLDTETAFCNATRAMIDSISILF